MSEQTSLERAKSKYSKTIKGKKCVSDYYFRTKPDRQQKQREWREARKAKIQMLERFYNKYKVVHPDFF